eukprot:TRINITY_DN7200_c0_g1_i2.p1 TRINITY_DN7200_c0_g1~~TRINITY_DN7200_c0_g1_i2.p1  ORF type:complete len:389 (+),score=46.88 TRINITY_DN7200_c0_g1_i2:527-1693(+)
MIASPISVVSPTSEERSTQEATNFGRKKSQSSQEKRQARTRFDSDGSGAHSEEDDEDGACSPLSSLERLPKTEVYKQVLSGIERLQGFSRRLEVPIDDSEGYRPSYRESRISRQEVRAAEEAARIARSVPDRKAFVEQLGKLRKLTKEAEAIWNGDGRYAALGSGHALRASKQHSGFAPAGSPRGSILTLQLAHESMTTGRHSESTSLTSPRAKLPLVPHSLPGLPQVSPRTEGRHLPLPLTTLDTVPARARNIVKATSQGLEYLSTVSAFNTRDAQLTTNVISPMPERQAAQVCLGRGHSGWVCVPANAYAAPQHSASSAGTVRPHLAGLPDRGHWAALLSVSLLANTGMTMEYGVDTVEATARPTESDEVSPLPRRLSLVEDPGFV